VSITIPKRGRQFARLCRSTTGANGSESLSTPASPASGDVSSVHSCNYDGSLSLLLANGLNFTVAGGHRDIDYLDPQGRTLALALVNATH